MFEKLKEYSLYIILWLIALWTLSYAYISVTNTQRWALIDENNSKAIMNTLIKTDQQKQWLTVAEELLKVNWWKNIWSYKIDNSKVSYVIWETYDDIFENWKLINIAANFENLESWQIRTILIANPAVTIEWSEDVKLIELNKDNTLEYWENVITREELRELSNTLKWYNISAIWYWPFSNLQEAKNFRNSYFSTYEIFQIWDSWQYIVLKEYKVSNSENTKTKLSSNENNNTWWNNNEEDDDDSCKQDICLDDNWVTKKAWDDTTCWYEYWFQWELYYVACNKNDLETKLFDEWYPANRIITTKVTDMSMLFMNPIYNDENYYYCDFSEGFYCECIDRSDTECEWIWINLEFDNISSWDTSNVTNMQAMFIWNETFNDNIWNWNVSNVKDMELMFSNSKFNNNISNWNVSNVINMWEMFSWNKKFDQPIWNWNVSNVTNMTYMFSTSIFNQDISKWNVSKVTDMSGMFAWSKFDQPIWSWNISNVTNMRSMFFWSKFDQPIWNWNTSNVKDMSWMFYGSKFNQDIQEWNVSNVTDMNSMFSQNKVFNQPIWKWNVSNVKDMHWMFDMTEAFNQPLDTWNVSNVTNMCRMFARSNFNQPIWNWNISNVTALCNIFDNNKQFNQPLNNWNTSNVQTMRWMFNWTTSFNQPLNNWNTSKVKNMSSLFSSATSFNQDISWWNTSSVTEKYNFDLKSSFSWTSDKKPVFN